LNAATADPPNPNVRHATNIHWRKQDELAISRVPTRKRSKAINSVIAA
jgi:hypothetical protein